MAAEHVEDLEKLLALLRLRFAARLTDAAAGRFGTSRAYRRPSSIANIR